MKVLVTGASGQIGSTIVAHLNKDGIRPNILLRNSSSKLALKGLEYNSFVGDITNPLTLTEAFKGCDVIYHCAAMVTFWKKNWAKAHQVNVGGTQNVVDACLKARVNRLVYTSSVAAVGYSQNPSDRVTEESPWNYGKHHLVYYQSKRLAEEVVMQAVIQNKLSAVCINPSIVLGPRDLNLTAGKLFQQIQKNRGFIASPGSTGVCDVDDVAQVHLLAAQKAKDGERFIINAKSLPFKELMCKVAHYLNKPQPILTAPATLMRLAGYLTDFLYQWQNNEPLITRDIAISSILDANYDGSKAERILGLQYTPLEVSIEKTATWLRENGFLN